MKWLCGEKYALSVAGYEGIQCDIDIDECAGDPCLNGGTCEDLVDGFRCYCADGKWAQL